MRTLAAGTAWLAMVGAAMAAEGPTTRPRPVVEVAFVLDTTGSMSGLIEGAKQKIWSIANQIVRGNPRPSVKFGLIGYRDQGDAYVTKVFDLTANIDQIYEELMKFQAQGGGDTPEHVNKALAEAVEKMTWNADKKALKIIFLVGDAPPHMDYKDGYDYRKSAREAIAKGIVVNTIRCGGDTETARVWREIADLAEGQFVSIDQSGGVQVVRTPFDDDLAKLSAELGGTVVAYGDARARGRVTERHAAMAEALSKPAAAPAGADRAEFTARSGRLDEADLLDAVRDKKLDLNTVDEEKLPDNLQKMSKEERQKYLDDLAAKREAIQAKIKDLSEKRQTFIKDQMSKGAGKGDAFDEQVLRMLRAQAEKKGITY